MKILSFFAPTLFGVFVVFRFILILGDLFGRNGIVSAGEKLITPKQSEQRQKEALEGSVGFDCFYCITRAGRIIPAHRRKLGRNMLAVKSDGGEHKAFHYNNTIALKKIKGHLLF